MMLLITRRVALSFYSEKLIWINEQDDILIGNVENTSLASLYTNYDATTLTVIQPTLHSLPGNFFLYYLWFFLLSYHSIWSTVLSKGVSCWISTYMCTYLHLMNGWPALAVGFYQIEWPLQPNWMTFATKLNHLCNLMNFNAFFYQLVLNCWIWAIHFDFWTLKQ